MATKTTETVTPNPLSPEQTAFNQGSIDAEAYRNDLVRQLAPQLVELMKTGGADSDFINQVFRSSGLYSDEALAIAQGVQYTPPGGSSPTAGTAGNPPAFQSPASQPAQSPGIGHNNPPQGVGLSPNFQQFPALAGAFADMEREYAQYGYDALPPAQAMAAAEELGRQISAGGVPSPEIMGRYNAALWAGTKDARQGVLPQGGQQGGGSAQQGLGLAPTQQIVGQGPVPQTFQSAPFDPTADYGLVANAADTAITAGQKDIDRFFGDAMKVLNDQAASRGMRFGDTPILDRGGQIATDVLRQKEDLAQGIRAQQASLNLTYPLEKYTTLSNVGVNEGRLGLDTRSLAQNAEQFNSEMNLRNRTLGADVAQRGVENRLAATNALMDRYNFGVNSGLNLLSVTRPNAPQFPDPGSTATSKTKLSGIDSAGKLIGAAGGLLEGVGAIKSIFSSRALKDIHEDILPDRALEGVMNTPVSRWSYKGENIEHIGPMAEDFQQSFNIGDGKTISVIDAIGVLFAAVQGLGQRVEGMHHAIE